MYIKMVAFCEVKEGNSPWEWEDCAGYDEGVRDPSRARCIVVDGATEAYDSVRWVAQLVNSFVGNDQAYSDEPLFSLHPQDMATWFDLMQQRWLDEAPNTFANIFEERKFRTDGSFATMLCCQIDGLDGSEPIWTAAALGDTVLFHVRGAELLQQLPKIAAGEFGVNPDGVFTSPAAVGRMREKLVISQGAIAADDVLFVATDACAEWILNLRGTEEAQLWKTLRGVTDPETFSRMVADYRASGALKNDDVTLLRVEFFAEPPRLLAFPRL